MVKEIIGLLCIVPLVLFVVTILLIVNARRKLKNFNECTGTIIAFRESTSELTVANDGSVAISPIIRYTVNGISYEFDGKYCTTAMKVGDDIKILYSKTDSAKASVKTGIIVAPIITGVLTVAFIIPIMVCTILCNRGIIS